MRHDFIETWMASVHRHSRRCVEPDLSFRRPHSEMKYAPSKRAGRIPCIHRARGFKAASAADAATPFREPRYSAVIKGRRRGLGALLQKNAAPATRCVVFESFDAAATRALVITVRLWFSCRRRRRPVWMLPEWMQPWSPRRPVIRRAREFQPLRSSFLVEIFPTDTQATPPRRKTSCFLWSRRNCYGGRIVGESERPLSFGIGQASKSCLLANCSRYLHKHQCR